MTKRCSGQSEGTNSTEVSIKERFKGIAYNLYQLVTLERKRIATALENS